MRLIVLAVLCGLALLTPARAEENEMALREERADGYHFVEIEGEDGDDHVDVRKLVEDMLDDHYIAEDVADDDDIRAARNIEGEGIEEKGAVVDPALQESRKVFVDAYLRALSSQMKLRNLDPLKLQIKRKGRVGIRRTGVKRRQPAKRRGQKNSKRNKKIRANKKRAAQKKAQRRNQRKRQNRINRKKANKATRLAQTSLKRHPKDLTIDGVEDDENDEEELEPEDVDEEEVFTRNRREISDIDLEEDEEDLEDLEDEDSFMDESELRALEGEVLEDEEDLGDEEELEDEEDPDEDTPERALRELSDDELDMIEEDEDEEALDTYREGKALAEEEEEVVDEDVEGRQRRRRRRRKGGRRRRKGKCGAKCRKGIRRRRNMIRRRRKIRLRNRRRKIAQQKASGNNSFRNKRSAASSTAILTGLSAIRRRDDVRIVNKKGVQKLYFDFEAGPVLLKAQRMVRNRRTNTEEMSTAQALAPVVSGRMIVVVRKDGTAKPALLKLHRPSAIQVTGSLGKRSSDKAMASYLKNSQKIVAREMMKTAKMILDKSNSNAVRAKESTLLETPKIEEIPEAA